MGAPRFFVDLDLGVGQRVTLPDAAAHHAQHALRLPAGAAITLFNGRGGEYAAKLVPGRPASADVTGFLPVERELAQRLVLVQAQVSRELTDWIVQKATELGAAAVVLAPTARSVVRLDPVRAQARLERALDTARAACEQCGRNRVPEIASARDWLDALALAAALAGSAGARALLLPDADDPPGAVARADSVAIAVGPEGGLTGEELAAARDAGWTGVRLGPATLRTETAGLAALAAMAALHAHRPPAQAVAPPERGQARDDLR